MTKLRSSIRLSNIVLSIILFLGITVIPVHAFETCESYDPVKDILKVKCSISFTQLATEINDSSKIAYLGNGEWLLNTTISTDLYTTFSITSKNENISWLKINNGNGIIIRGRIEIDGLKITSWNSINNKVIDIQNKNIFAPRGYIYILSSNGGWINNSDIGYLGYRIDSKEGAGGFSLYDSHDIILSNNKFHDNYFAFYSDNSYNITVDNNEYYHNLLYAIDPHTGSHDFRISNNHVHNNYKFGIIFSLRCYNFLVENNTVHDNNEGKTDMSYGIFSSRVSDNNVIRNNIIYNETNGIDLSQSSNNTVYGNKISNTQRGIFIISGKEGVSKNNYIHDNEILKSKSNIAIKNSRGNRIINNTNGIVGSVSVILNNEEKFSRPYIYNKTTFFLSNIFRINYSKDNIVNNTIGTEINYSQGNIKIADNSLEPETRKNSTVIITFDDGSRTVYDNAFPILQANNQKAVAYIIVGRSDRYNNYMNWSILKKLYDSGWDISSHTVNHVNLLNLDNRRLNYELNMSLNILISKGFERSAKFIAYPFGENGDNVTSAAKANGYLTGRTTMRQYMTGSTKLTHNNNTLYTMTVFEILNDTSITDTEKVINETINKNRNLILVYHIITPDSNTSMRTQSSVSNFKIISDYIASRKNDISVITMSEYYNSIIKERNIENLDLLWKSGG